MRIKFDFKPAKLVQALAFFASRDIPELTKLKAAKLIYLADKLHLLKHGRPIIGDCYYCMDQGPVPSEALDEMNRLVTPDEVPDSRKIYRETYLQREKKIWQKHPVIAAKREPDLDVFSDSDIEALEDIASRYGQLPIGKLLDIVHADPAVKRAHQERAPGGRSDMPYELFFEQVPEAQRREVLDIIEAEQECRDAANSLRNAGSSEGIFA